MQPAISSGLPRRPSGTLPRIVCLRDSGQPLRHGGFNKAGRHAVGGDTSTCHFMRQRLGHADHARFGRGVVGLSRTARRCYNRGDADDPPPALLEHAAQQRSRQPERRRQIDGENGVPVVVGHPEHELIAGDPGIVDEDVDPAQFGRSLSRPAPPVRRARPGSPAARGWLPGRSRRRAIAGLRNASPRGRPAPLAPQEPLRLQRRWRRRLPSPAPAFRKDRTPSAPRRPPCPSRACVSRYKWPIALHRSYAAGGSLTRG